MALWNGEKPELFKVKFFFEMRIILQTFVGWEFTPHHFLSFCTVDRLPPLPDGVHLPPLAGRDGLRLLLRLLRHTAQGGAQAGGPVVPEEPERP